MSENQEAGRPSQELAFQSAIQRKECISSSRDIVREEQQWQKSGLTHKELVTGILSYIQRIREVDAQLETEPRTNAEIIRAKIDLEIGAREAKKSDFYLPLTIAFDAIAYSHYPLRSLAGSSANFLLSDYSGVRLRAGEYKERSIVLSEPQIRMLDALAEVAGIPQPRGQNEIQIPFDAMRERHRIFLSGAEREYEEEKRGRAEGISDEELSRRQKAVSVQMEREWQDYARRSLQVETSAHQ